MSMVVLLKEGSIPRGGESRGGNRNRIDEGKSVCKLRCAMGIKAEREVVNRK